MIAKNVLSILWVCFLAGFVSAWLALLLACPAPSPSFLVSLFVLVLGMAIWSYLTVRILQFGKRLTDFLNLLLSGNYEVDIQTKREDELSSPVRLLSRLGDQIRTYDKLSAEKVSLSSRALELITKSVSEGVITADLEERTFGLNPTAQSLFNVTQGSFSFDSIENQEKNEGFMALFKQATQEEKVTKEGNAVLQLPMLESERNVVVKIIPLKDAEEAVKLAFIFVELRGPSEPTPVSQKRRSGP
jgi:signal transduction histidine kinase